MVAPVDIVIHFLWLIGGLVLLYFGAEWLVKGASEIALRLGISPLVVGLTVVAFGTSMPELLVCLKANSPRLIAAPLEWLGWEMDMSDASPDIALGNIVGSNIFNIALILGVAALIRPIEVHSQLIKRELPILLVSSVAFVVMMHDMRLDHWEGAVLAIGIMVYIYTSVRSSKGDSCASHQFEDFEEDAIEGAKKGGGRIVVDFGLVVVGIGALGVGADWLVNHGEWLASKFGVPEVIISLTLFALGTSLPELATTIVASLKKQGDIITGNAIGSCVFNLLFVMGVTSGIKPLVAQDLAWLDLGVMLGLAALIVPFMWSRMRLSRLEGVILVMIAVGYSLSVILGQR